jgi:hypothetical protein
MRDAAARRALEARARQLVVERYDWSAVALGFEAALANAAGREPADDAAERWPLAVGS